MIHSAVFTVGWIPYLTGTAAQLPMPVAPTSDLADHTTHPVERPPPMTTDPYQCATYGEWYVVRILARDCEAKHARRTP